MRDAPLPAEGEAWPLTVQPETGVLRFALRPVTGIDPAAVSPWWLQRRLLLVRHPRGVSGGRRDELRDARTGPPDARSRPHARSPGVSSVRFAHRGETVVTLDNVERKLETG